MFPSAIGDYCGHVRFDTSSADLPFAFLGQAPAVKAAEQHLRKAMLAHVKTPPPPPAQCVSYESRKQDPPFVPSPVVFFLVHPVEVRV